MTVGGIFGTSSLYASSGSNRFEQRKEAFDALGNALSSGDLAGAQQAFASIQQGMQSMGKTLPSQAVQPTAQTNGIGADLDALSKSLGSGDLSGAQSAFATLQQDMQTMHSHRGHHHARGAMGGLMGVLNPAGSTSQTGSDLRTLLTSLSGGDFDGAQTAFDSLVTDLQQAQGGQQADNSVNPAADFQALSKSLDAGDLDGAKSAFATFQQDLLQVWLRQQPYEAAGVQAASAASTSGTMVNETA